MLPNLLILCTNQRLAVTKLMVWYLRTNQKPSFTNQRPSLTNQTYGMVEWTDNYYDTTLNPGTGTD